jgi:hypothetical protein
MGYARSICEDKPVGAFSFTLEKKRRARDRQAQVFSFAMRHLATSCATAAALDRPARISAGHFLLGAAGERAHAAAGERSVCRHRRRRRSSPITGVVVKLMGELLSGVATRQSSGASQRLLRPLDWAQTYPWALSR